MGSRFLSRKKYREQKQQNGKGRSAFKKMFLRTLIALILIGTLTLGVGGYTGMAYINEAPELNPELLKYPQSSTIYDMNNKKITDVAGKEYRKIAPIDKIPEGVQNAFIAVEDVRFWEHEGIDIKRIGGAVLANVTDGFGAEGASTITQQLVKKSFLTPEKSIKRKVQEAYLAIKMENEYSKKEILEMYLNKIYFGEGAYGVATAAEVYFGKSVEELNVSEAALLAGLPQRPSGYNPFNHPELAKERRDTVISLMAKHGFITQKEKEEAQSIPVKDLLHPKKRNVTYDGFIEQVVDELEEKGISESDLYSSGLKIYTTLDPKAQQFTDKVLSTDEYISYPDKKFKAGIVLLDTQTGEIRAIGGNRNPADEDIKKGFNYATQLKRQPGSTAKPILAYGPAIEKLKWSTYKQIKDEEIEANGKTFKNWDDKFHDEVSIRTALQWSYNIPAIKAFQEVGSKDAKNFAAKLGINLENAYPAHAIGGFKNGISPLQLAGAYAAFGNEGVYNEPHTVRKVVFADGKEKSFKPKSEQAMSDYTAYMITDMLKTVVNEGTGKMANISGLPLAGKTGTTGLPENIHDEGDSDAWFSGYTTRYTAAVWTGYDKTTKDSYIKKEDDDIAKLIFKHVVSEVSKGKETPDFKKPSSVVELKIDEESGLEANKNTPEDKITTELFVKGTEPEKKPVKESSAKNEVKKEKQEQNKEDHKKENSSSDKDKEKQKEDKNVDKKKKEEEKDKKKEQKKKDKKEDKKSKEEEEKQATDSQDSEQNNEESQDTGDQTTDDEQATEETTEEDNQSTDDSAENSGEDSSSSQDGEPDASTQSSEDNGTTEKSSETN
ncbi:transglycosylase domain-containing protein [Pseudalkalibacillus caeni]|uniref:PBP1A family penicillin-binding protein n=1 Tax=Exobacillus caeni TaxID=2574798 RepID=A0A5R9FE85_9BACL|nr:PBP1A family penicillin-binding protein [Pseudalkalibacillus caeni]TLS37925.1 PBP1A family penicillin-binding protein [Pseudalkalibacillus caeni]